ncbi:isoleucine--tRNA ligase, chloroplastic/mitochondrial-like isoform X1 [Eucalyptus grandis]|uniref:isoleucine--tRNA ligase, chloroplastic/mitochondrial-like isoform X1 n=1 Tax=Eucalyptus grandis TaxID=71139 RepID=UPI00192EDA2A|nr:isoleucine--tRNA ligase, chloroplastic/mitochondrial-like isoform X1 [Eucalyptus grandis]
MNFLLLMLLKNNACIVYCPVANCQSYLSFAHRVFASVVEVVAIGSAAAWRLLLLRLTKLVVYGGQVLTQRTCSCLGKTASVNKLFYLRGSSSLEDFSLLGKLRFCSFSSTDVPSLKRRSRGPVMAAKKAAEGGKQDEGRYKHTVALPRTSFGMRANASVREPEIQKSWDENQVFKRIVSRNNGLL